MAELSKTSNATVEYGRVSPKELRRQLDEFAQRVFRLACVARFAFVLDPDLFEPDPTAKPAQKSIALAQGH